MNDRTGEIKRFETVEEAARAGFNIPVTEREADMMRGWSKKKRREWWREEKARRASKEPR